MGFWNLKKKLEKKISICLVNYFNLDFLLLLFKPFFLHNDNWLWIACFLMLWVLSSSDWSWSWQACFSQWVQILSEGTIIILSRDCILEGTVSVVKIWCGRGKGQLISKCPFGVIVWTKIPTKKFALESKKCWNQQ